MAAARIDAVVVQDDTLFTGSNARAVADLAAAKRMVAVGSKALAEAGGTIGYGGTDFELYRRGAYFVDRILQGRKAGRPADRAGDPIRARAQCEGRQSAGPSDSRRDGAARRPRDRVRRAARDLQSRFASRRAGRRRSRALAARRGSGVRPMAAVLDARAAYSYHDNVIAVRARPLTNCRWSGIPRYVDAGGTPPVAHVTAPSALADARDAHLRSIKSKLVAFALLATLVPSVGLGLLSFWRYQAVLDDNVSHELRTLRGRRERRTQVVVPGASQRAAHAFDRVHAERRIVGRNGAATGRGPTSARANWNSTCAPCRASSTRCWNSRCPMPPGRWSRAARRRPLRFALPATWPNDAITEGVVLGPPRWDDARGTATLTVVVPVLSPRNELLGALTAVLDLATVDAALAGLARSSPAEVMLLAPDGKPLLGTRVGGPRIDAARSAGARSPSRAPGRVDDLRRSPPARSPRGGRRPPPAADDRRGRARARRSLCRVAHVRSSSSCCWSRD